MSSGPNAEGPNAGQPTQPLPGDGPWWRDETLAAGVMFEYPAAVEATFYDNRQPRPVNGPPLASAQRYNPRGWVLHMAGMDYPAEHWLFEQVIRDVTTRTGVRSLVIVWEYRTEPADVPPAPRPPT